MSPELPLHILATVAFSLWSANWIFFFIAIAVCKFKLHKELPVGDEPLPPISVIKPVVGVDSKLYANLESFFLLKYPKFELLFGCQSRNDPATLVITALRDKYPHVDAQLFFPPELDKEPKQGARSTWQIGANPKVNNISQVWSSVKYDLIWIADSGIRATDACIKDLALHMKPDVGLVHHLPYVADMDAPSLAGVFHHCYFGTYMAKMYLSLNVIGIPCSNGMSNLIRKEVVDKSGGWKYFGQFLGEDFFLLLATKTLGFKAVLGNEFALQAGGDQTISNLQNRHMRWAQLRAYTLPFTMVLEPISECFLAGSLAALAAWLLFDASPLVFFLTNCLCWFLLDYMLVSALNTSPLKFTKCEFLLMWLLRESTSLLLWFRAACRRTVTWRGKTFVLRFGGRIERVTAQVKKPIIPV